MWGTTASDHATAVVDALVSYGVCLYLFHLAPLTSVTVAVTLYVVMIVLFIGYRRYLRTVRPIHRTYRVTTLTDERRRTPVLRDAA
ncbi:hypothetical protein SAMN05421595_2982 [Austwickia chelonae]|uniref:Uncharacterized protein n=1 Tax=Austwickia chelonae NBRC 105200 TaxID=1184607 RepID=K6WBB7_9MICO|nr:hypothetical protein [Austwickia chelonae]GAB79122.1 hypothetical protein AUCHE_19_00260 [Austwickia chelonae NBRC 105200]SEW42455.1 hypothetical protein SAMN05421595_2982 [Austwickia chelonae]